MALTVEFSNGESTDYAEDVKFYIEDNGTLRLTFPGSRVYYAAHAWRRVETDRKPSGRVATAF